MVQRPPLHGPPRPHRADRQGRGPAGDRPRLSADRWSRAQDSPPRGRRGRFPHSPICRNGRTRAFMARNTFPSFRRRTRPPQRRPRDATDIALESPARRRLAYDEILCRPAALALVRAPAQARRRHPLARRRLHRKENPPPPCPGRSPHPRSRPLSRSRRIWGGGFTRSAGCALLQGDVGSGKTVVALLAMARAAEAGRQSALMAPTEILARQQFFDHRAARRGRRPSRRHPHGREKGRERAAIMAAIERAAPTSSSVPTRSSSRAISFHDLALAIIDEQHRFGVHQRLAMTAKGPPPPTLLVMTANAHPAHFGADRLRRHGRLEAPRKAARPRRPVRTVTLPGRPALDELVTPHGRGRRRGPEGLLDLPAGRGIPRRAGLMSAGAALFVAETPVPRAHRPGPWSHVRAATRTRPCGPSRPARRGCSSARR